MLGYRQQFEYEIEESPERKIQGITQGQFILDGDTIFLQTRKGDRFGLDRVAIASGAFNDVDGVLRFPRPSIYDSNGKMTQQGDLVIVAFEYGDIFNPIVLSSVIPINYNDFFHAFTREDYQKKKARFETDSATIEFQDDGEGHIQLDIEANGATLTINVSGNVAINSEGTATVKGDSKVIVDSPSIELGKNATEALVKGTSWSTLYQAHVHPTGMGPSGPPTNAAQANTVLSSRNKTL